MKAEGAEDRFVTNNLDTLLTALYVELDDRVLPTLGWTRDHRPGRKPALPMPSLPAWHRQWIEAIIDTLKGQLTLEHHGGRTLAGVYARVAARLLPLAAAIWHNWRTGAPVKRSLLAYDH
jgi:hypothetical protein